MRNWTRGSVAAIENTRLQSSRSSCVCALMGQRRNSTVELVWWWWLGKFSCLWRRSQEASSLFCCSSGGCETEHLLDVLEKRHKTLFGFGFFMGIFWNRKNIFFEEDRNRKCLDLKNRRWTTGYINDVIKGAMFKYLLPHCFYLLNTRLMESWERLRSP